MEGKMTDEERIKMRDEMDEETRKKILDEGHRQMFRVLSESSEGFIGRHPERVAEMERANEARLARIEQRLEMLETKK
jgi:hypothetical protein